MRDNRRSARSRAPSLMRFPVQGCTGLTVWTRPCRRDWEVRSFGNLRRREMRRITSGHLLPALTVLTLSACVQTEFVPITSPPALLSPAYETIQTDAMVLFEWTTVPNGQ